MFRRFQLYRFKYTRQFNDRIKNGYEDIQEFFIGAMLGIPVGYFLGHSVGAFIKKRLPAGQAGLADQDKTRNE